jgi:hypothetical protein
MITTILISLTVFFSSFVLLFLLRAFLWIKPYKIGQRCAHYSWAHNLVVENHKTCFDNAFGEKAKVNFIPLASHPACLIGFQEETKEIARVTKNNPFYAERLRREIITGSLYEKR